jgi:hypothetical protein
MAHRLFYTFGQRHSFREYHGDGLRLLILGCCSMRDATASRRREVVVIHLLVMPHQANFPFAYRRFYIHLEGGRTNCIVTREFRERLPLIGLARVSFGPRYRAVVGAMMNTLEMCIWHSCLSGIVLMRCTVSLDHRAHGRACTFVYVIARSPPSPGV